MQTGEMRRVDVWRGMFSDPVPLFEPLPGVRTGDILAYEFELPERFIPKPGHERLERTFVLGDLGVSMAWPAWLRTTTYDGRSVSGMDPELDDAVTWYVHLVRRPRARQPLIPTQSSSATCMST
jgi:hypothetical protein